METVEYHVINRVGYITLNRPEKRNALNATLVTDLTRTFKQAEADDAVKVIILKAKGEAFCSGADLAYLQQLQNFSYEENVQDSNNLKELFLLIYTLKKIVIAQVQGHALAGGCGLANVCDFTFSVPEAKFGYTEVKIGFVPAIVMTFLIRKIGEGPARNLLLSGELIAAEEAKRMGLVNVISPREDLENSVDIFARKLVEANSAHAMMLTKQMIARIQSLSLQDAMTLAAEVNASARSTDDCKKGIAAFLNKEKINW